MGMYMIGCPTCKKAHYWFSGNLDQRCPDCRGVRHLTPFERAAMDKALESSQQIIDPGYQASDRDEQETTNGTSDRLRRGEVFATQ